ncbi:MAG: hypothetical protein HQ472_03105 [Ignavibacteria bacterium]|nr:hypothetical protein [Ignavibacteria bacterium]
MNIFKSIQAGTIVSACFFMLCFSVNVKGQIGADPKHSKPLTDSLIVPFWSLGRTGFSEIPISYELTKKDRRGVQYRSLPDAMIRHSPFLPMSQGGFGQYNAVSIFGSNVANQSVSMDGRSVFDPWNGQYNLEHVAVDGLETTQLLTGTHAIGLASTLTQQSINLQSMRFNTATPYTAFWYAQGGGDFIAADVALAQNISKKTNVSVGIRRTGANGRYLNTHFDIWNIRSAVRVAFTAQTQGLLTYQLTSANSGMWGGLRTVTPLETQSESLAQPVFLKLQDQSRRHDLTLNLIHLLNPDSSKVLSMLAYGSIDNMLRIRDSTIRIGFVDTGNDVTFRGIHGGVLVRYELNNSNFNLKLGGGLDYSTVNETPYTSAQTNCQPQTFFHFGYKGISDFVLSAAGRVQMNWDRLLFGGGINGTYAWTPKSNVIFDFSYAQYAPQATQGIQLLPEDHLLGSITVNAKTSDVKFEGSIFVRSIQNVLSTQSNRDSLQLITATTTSNGGAAFVSGVNVSGLWQNSFLEIKANARFSYSRTQNLDDKIFPLLYTDAYAAYVYRVGTSEIKLGVRGVLVSPMNSSQYVPLTWTFIQPVQQQNWASSGMDVFLLAVLGNASVKISYENILAQRWYSTAINPEIVRDLRLSVTWSFFD